MSTPTTTTTTFPSSVGWTTASLPSSFSWTTTAEDVSTLISTTTTTTTAAATAAATTLTSSIGSAKTQKTMTMATTTTSTTAFTATAGTTATDAKMNVADLSASLQHFGYVDYIVFITMLLVCAGIGFYFGFIEKKKKNDKHATRRGSEALDYLVGGRKMKVFPVSLSLVASFVSGISLLGTSTEIYVYGTKYAFILITLALSGVISWYIFLPVFCNLQLTSTYEMIRFIAIAINQCGNWGFMPVLPFDQVSGIDIHTVTPVVCVVCTFYTCVGGLKAVIWTDVIQSFVMYGSVLAVAIKGTIDVGGLRVVLQRNEQSGRLNAPEWTWDPTVRLSMASVFIGGTLHKIQSSAVNQISIQRFLSLPNYKAAKQSMLIFTILLTLLLFCCQYIGLVAYAKYHDCDPITTKLARASDQLPSLLMMETLGGYVGLPGIFVAGVFSAALSSLSTGLNSLACVISQDMIKPCLRQPLSEFKSAVLLRLIVVVFGIGCIFLVAIVEKLGLVLQLSSMASAVTMAPLLGIYTIGVCLPWIKGKYFELRFDRRVRLLGSFLFIAMEGFWMPISIYVPALTFNQVTGINVHIIVPIVCVVTTIYTSIGGIKGVVWTDVIQGIVMVGSMALVIIKGTIQVGGLSVLIERNAATARLVPPDLTFDPTVRMGIFAVLVGGTFFKLQGNSINQTIVQRFLTLPNMKAVKKSLICSMLGFILVIGMCVYIGLLAFAKYYHCDPITTGLAHAKDQVIPLYVMEIGSAYPGFVGLFVAGVFSAALSSLSTTLNSMSAVILKDFIEPCRQLTERQTAFFLRSVVLVLGLSSMGMVHVVERLGMVMQLSATIAAIGCGPLLGAFTVGMMLPFVNGKSVFTGCTITASLLSYVVARAQVAFATGEMEFPIKQVSVDGCTYDFELSPNWNATFNDNLNDNKEFQFYRVSFLWYTILGAGGVVFFSLLATLYFGKQDINTVDPQLLTPLVRNYWMKRYSSVANDEKIKDKDYQDIDKEFNDNIINSSTKLEVLKSIENEN